MNKSIKCFVFVCASLMSFACNKIEEEPYAGYSNGVELTITAAKEDYIPDTRTIRESDGSVEWCPLDEISVFYNDNGEGGNRFVAQNTAQTAIAEFKGVVEDFSIGGEDFTNGKYLYGVYPYSATTSFSNGVTTITLPAIQTAEEGTFSNGLFPTIARSQGLNMAFCNICGGVKFTVSRNDITTIIFKGNNGERLAGTANVVFDANEKPFVLDEEVNSKTEIIVYAPDSSTFEAGKEYYIVAFPTKLDNGFTFTFKTIDIKEGSYVSDKPVEIQRSVFGVVEQADENVIFEKINLYSKSPVDLSLAIWENGIRYYLTKEEYINADLSECIVEGLTVVDDNESFIISLNNVQTNLIGATDVAKSIYGDILPTKEQGQIISARWDDINAATIGFGGDELSASYYTAATARVVASSSGATVTTTPRYEFPGCVTGSGGVLSASRTVPHIRGVKTTDYGSEIFWRDPDDLKLSVIIAGSRVFLNKQEYDEVASEIESVEGVLVVAGGEKFIVHLNDAQASAISNAAIVKSQYSDILPTMYQGQIISAKWKDINDAITSFGGTALSASSYYYTAATVSALSSAATFTSNNMPTIVVPGIGTISPDIDDDTTTYGNCIKGSGGELKTTTTSPFVRGVTVIE